ncbi:MAG: HD domain-containing protein [Nanoarchaeota archaeon]|nr:HD domain-containing protein [Nanoarchaeota archaeon]
MNNEFYETLKEKIQIYFELGGSHAFDHTQRVYNLALRLSKNYKLDMDVLKAAALLHDVARLKEDKEEVVCHAEHGAKMAEEILKEMDFPNEKIEKVCYAISIHRHSKRVKADTKEAQILQDADRLDALGAITIARMFSTGGKIGIPLYKPEIPLGKIYPGYKSDSTIHGFYVKILKIIPSEFNTEEAKRIAKKRYKFVEEFLEQFKLEWEGKD